MLAFADMLVITVASLTAGTTGALLVNYFWRALQPPSTPTQQRAAPRPPPPEPHIAPPPSAAARTAPPPRGLDNIAETCPRCAQVFVAARYGARTCVRCLHSWTVRLGGTVNPPPCGVP